MVKDRNAASNGSSVDDVMYRMLDGQHHLDEICMRCQMSAGEVMAKIDDDPEVLFLTR